MTTQDRQIGTQARLSRRDVLHAVVDEMVSIELDPDSDPPKVLLTGPDTGGNPRGDRARSSPTTSFVIHATEDAPPFTNSCPSRRAAAAPTTTSMYSSGAVGPTFDRLSTSEVVRYARTPELRARSKHAPPPTRPRPATSSARRVRRFLDVA